MKEKSSLPRETEGERKAARVALFSLPVALAFWYIIFVLPFSNFWPKMAVATILLAATSVIASRHLLGELFAVRPRHIVIGVASAVFLYGVFWLGKVVLTAVLPTASGSIGAVYATGTGIPPGVIALLLLFVSSPSEEIYWRGFIQRILAGRLGRWGGYALAVLLYTGVHIVTLNLPLILAAFTASLVWGWIFAREGSIVPGIISHSLWATTIFVIAPVM